MINERTTQCCNRTHLIQTPALSISKPIRSITDQCFSHEFNDKEVFIFRKVAPLKEFENETVGHTLEWNQLKKKLNNF
jgi:hypothetical protein